MIIFCRTYCTRNKQIFLVFEIILKYLETKNWQRAFYDVIPKRKGLSLVDKDNEEYDEQARENVVEFAKYFLCAPRTT